jgi:hypothetical protein
LKLANLAGLADETLFVVEPQASLLGDTGTKLVTKLRTDSAVMKTEMDKPRSSLLTGQIKQANAVCDATLDDIKRSIKAGATGKAITPIPVMYYEGTELVFAVDFSLTYKNNVDVGEATVIMHGKGRFNGQHIRKFNIART